MRRADKLDALEKAVSTLRLSMGRCADDVQALKQGFSLIDSKLKYVEYKTIDLATTSRQNNLLFHGISETNRNGDYEDLNEIIRDFMVNMLGRQDGHSMDIQAAYRLGNSRKYDHGRGEFGVRPILVVFKDYLDAESIIDQARALRGTRYAISRDYPRELNDARKKLLPMMKQARRERKPAQILYPARLVINGEVTRDEFPGWEDIVSGDTDSSTDQQNFTSDSKDQNGNSSHGNIINGGSSGNWKRMNHTDYTEVEPGWTLVVDSHRSMKKWKSCDTLISATKDKKRDGHSNYTAWKRRGNVRGNRYFCDDRF